MTDKKKKAAKEADHDLGYEFETTEEIPVPDRMVDQIVGQERGVEIIKKAAKQRRNVLLIGDPGNGKSMLGQAMAELLPKEELEDILVYPNPDDQNTPKIRVVKAEEGRCIVEDYRERAKKDEKSKSMLLILISMAVVFYGFFTGQVLMAVFVAVITVFLGTQLLKSKSSILVPKLLIDNSEKDKAPFFDATGAHAGALLGDVRHDPFQSGGMGTPPHERVESGMIHRAHKGVLFIDEISTFKINMQQAMLTAIQNGKYPITGQSEMSSGAMVRTKKVPCDFILVAAGNIETLKGMHPALRSRMRGYGYEVYMSNTMPDTVENRRKLVRVVAQEVEKDGKIPHFTKNAVKEIINEARRRAGRKNSLTLIIRDLGGMIRAAGDVAIKGEAEYVTIKHVKQARTLARSLEHQIADDYIEKKKEYRVFDTSGTNTGRVNGLAVLGGKSGIIMPIEAEAAPAGSKNEGRIIATGKLGEIATESISNVSALIKKKTGKTISDYDIHIQFLQAYEGVEGDSASVSVAASIISAIKGIPIRQDLAMTGSLSVRGKVLPVGGITAKVEAAIGAGMEEVVLPESNKEDVYLQEEDKNKIKITPVSTLDELLDHVLVKVKE
ncbi:MAG: ATP-dependent protease LonB [Euryarchaeota archaeon]|nr:ATP-dependent protease LonB [Euryarchaeota archaeon]